MKAPLLTSCWLVMVWMLLFLSSPAIGQEEDSAPSRNYETDILTEVFKYSAADLSVPRDLVFQGCPARDCIPSIDQPKFISVNDVDYLTDEDLLLVVEFNDEKRAYPTRVLDIHEIVNDRFDATPVLVSYCPLCGSGLAFVRRIDGEEVEFGVSGLLHNNDLIMYDRRTESLWQQITGTAIAGPQRDVSLEPLPLTMSYWGEWRVHNPDALVLGMPGSPERYGKLYYSAYEDSDQLLFPVTATDARLKPKRIIYGLELPGVSVAVDEAWLKEQGAWTQRVEGSEIGLVVTPSGGVKGTVNGAAVAVHRMFWFAWYSFHTDTLLIDGRQSGN